MAKLHPSRLGLLALSVIGVLGLTACGGSSGSGSVKPVSSVVPNTAVQPNTGNTANSSTGTNNSAPTSSGATFDAKIHFHDREGEQDLKEEFGLDSVKVTARYLNGKKSNETFVDLSKLASGLQTINERIEVDLVKGGKQHHATGNNKYVIYKQPYSVVVGDLFVGSSSTLKELGEPAQEQFETVLFTGQPTKVLPKAGTYNYKGVVFNRAEDTGTLNYSIDFDKRTGQGSAAFRSQTATLNQANIGQIKVESDRSSISYSGIGISGTATAAGRADGQYFLGIFGDNAEEIAGTMQFGHSQFGLAGTHQK